MNKSKDISIEEYNYHLPNEKIALFPSENRDESKLLIFRDNTITEDIFKNIPLYLNQEHLLVFNNTRVIQARMLFSKSSGSTIELFCLEPLAPTTLHSLIFETKASCEWECFVGNNKRYTIPLRLHFDYGEKKGILQAEKLGKCNATSFKIRFSWTPEHLSFAEVLDSVGKVPLPPYIKRKVTVDDIERYQTIYARQKGSVAAPTAGLHFTPEVLNNLSEKNISAEYITLHVGAGTFKPISETTIENHIMHCEQLLFTKQSIKQLIYHCMNKKIIAVGTTTARSLESLYWIGVKITALKQNKIPATHSPLHITQWEAYEYPALEQLSVEQSLMAVLNFMDENNLNILHASTALMITPDYQTKMVKGIITNFHQPKSTLLLLIAAFVGNKWKEIYNYALTHDFRFLSYGDACLFL
ncbi:MAG: S-adenosylmethionine:tRNA ribosyltransferase-isomerase [Bacteroidales bacterium]|jgi:S-adenosylmethionine:tRNA ribosyltransferase-isomerase|nr:S-adenosylmethionine:tRNA ribosyltransferase-isomerase [Bacteroidales bacterium]